MLRLPHLITRRMSAAVAITGVAVLIPVISLASPGRPAAADGRAATAHGSVTAARCPAGSLTDRMGSSAGGRGPAVPPAGWLAGYDPRTSANCAASAAAPSCSRDTSGPDRSSDRDALGMTRSGQAANTRPTSAGVAP
jgi:hypothetical protein